MVSGSRQHEDLGALLVLAARLHQRRLAQKLAGVDVTPTQLTVLRVLWEGDGRAISQLAAHSHADAPTMTGIVDRLERLGLVERRRHARDRRVITLHLTAAGRQLQGELPRLQAATDQEAVAGVPAAEVAPFLQTLRTVIANLADQTRPHA